MQKILFLAIFLFISSCEGVDLLKNMGCGVEPSYTETQDAQWYYYNAGASVVSNPSWQIKDLFKCYYYPSDYIYSYKTFWHEGYILVRKNKAIISVETK